MPPPCRAISPCQPLLLEKIGKAEAEADYREKVLPLITVRYPFLGSSLARTIESGAPISVDQIFSLQPLLRRTIPRKDIISMAAVSCREAFTLKSGPRRIKIKRAVRIQRSRVSLPSSACLRRREHLMLMLFCKNILGDMDVDDSGSSEDDDEEREDTADVGMTPMADMLNARHSCNNVRLNHMRTRRLFSPLGPIRLDYFTKKVSSR